MEAQKCLRNSGFLPPLAADGVYDHNCAVPSTVRHAERAQERPAPEVSAGLVSKKTNPSLADLAVLAAARPSWASRRLRDPVFLLCVVSYTYAEWFVRKWEVCERKK